MIGVPRTLPLDLFVGAGGKKFTQTRIKKLGCLWWLRGAVSLCVSTGIFESRSIVEDALCILFWVR